MPTNFFKLALRNIFLYRRRSFLTGTVMAFSVTAILFAAALGEAFYHQLVNVGILTTTGHVLIIPEGWDMDLVQPVGGNIPTLKRVEEIERIVRKAPHVEHFSQEIIYQMLLFDKTDSFFQGALLGVQPEKVKYTLSGVRVLEGEEFSSGVKEGVYISPIAQDFFKENSSEKLQVGNRMYILTGGPLGMLEGIKTRLKGIALTMPLFGDNVAITNVTAVQDLLGWENYSFTTMKIMLENKDQAELVAEWIQKELREAGFTERVFTWKKYGGFFYHIALIGRFMVVVLLLILSIITAITVSNTMMMSVKERTREIGTVMAMGMKRKGVINLFLIESFALALIASLVGLLIGVVMILYFSQVGFMHGISILIEGALFPVLEGIPILFSFVWIVVSGVIGGVYPAYHASKLNPITALRSL